MGQIFKKDFNGADFNQKIKDNPQDAEYYASCARDYDYSSLKLEGLSPLDIFKTGKDYYEGENGREWNMNTAKKYYQAASEKGCVQAMLELAYQYQNEVFPFYTNAMRWYKNATEQVQSGAPLANDLEVYAAKAKYRTAEMYENGEGVEQDYKQAVHWYEEAGKSGADFSVEVDGDKINWKNLGLSRAGTIYYFGEEGVPRDRAKAVEYFRRAADSDYEQEAANYYLGIEYLKGVILEKDYEKARDCFENAVNYGSSWALGCLDYMYESGMLKNSGYNSVALWYKEKNIYGKAAEQLAYAFIDRDNLLSEISDYHKKILSALPEESRLYKVINRKEDGYDKGVLWLERAAENNYERALYQLINLYHNNRDNGLQKAPAADKIAYFVNKIYPVDENTRKIVFTLKDCDEFIDKFLRLSLFTRREGLLSLDLKDEEDNFYIKIGKTLIACFVDYYIIKTIMEFLLEIDKKEGVDLAARKIIVQGIFSVQAADNEGDIRKKLYDILGDDAAMLLKELDRESLPADNPWIYYKKGHLHYHNKDWDKAISDFQKAIELACDEDDRKNFSNLLANVCYDKQSAQTLEERMAPYAQMIEKIKSARVKSISDFLLFKTVSDYAEFAAALAFFEEYELLKILLEDANNSPLFASGSTPLNERVSAAFAFWGPTPFYFITSKRTWKKMREPEKTLKFLAALGADIDAEAADGTTALFNQTYRDCETTEILKVLLEMGANPNKTVISEGVEWTPLVQCLIPGHEEENGEDFLVPFNDLAVEQAKLLLEKGADPNLISSDMTDYPPLVMAIKYGFITEGGPVRGERASGVIDLLKLLIQKGANVNFLDSDRNTPLSIAKKNNLTEAEDLLLEQWASLPGELEPDDDGRHDAWS